MCRYFDNGLFDFSKVISCYTCDFHISDKCPYWVTFHVLFKIRYELCLAVDILFLVVHAVFSVFFFGLVVVVVQSPNRVRLFVTPWTAGHQASRSFTISRSLLKLMSVESVMPSNHLILCRPLLLLLSQHQGLFQWVGCLHQVAKALGLYELLMESFWEQV